MTSASGLTRAWCIADTGATDAAARCNLHGTWRGPSVGMPRDVAADEEDGMVEEGAERCAEEGEGGEEINAGEEETMQEAA